MLENITILLVDDEKDILEFLSYNLKKEGCNIITTTNGKNAIEIALKEMPHLIILDVMMPGIDGIETCQKIRSIPKLKNILIAFLTARSEDYSEIAGFDSGADDYITKPIKPKILISRIKALLRRGLIKKEDIITYNDLEINAVKHIVQHKNKKIDFTKKEFNLLYLLMSTPGKVYSRQEIISNIWEENTIVGDRTIDVHIKKIREKLENNYIKTIKGVGYKFDD